MQYNMRLALLTLTLAAALQGCNALTDSQPGDDNMPDKASSIEGPSDILARAEADGADASRLIALAGRINRVSGDDDMPETTDRQCGGGVYVPSLIGCNPNGSCIYKTRDTCGRTYYLVEHSNGSHEWHGPQGCPSCSPWGGN